MKKNLFETPIVMGNLCDGTDTARRAMGARLAKHAKKIAYLPFQVRREHLRNTVACMRLMDIAAITVSGRHRKDIAKYLTHLEKGAKAARFVDSVIREGRRFVGHNAVGESVLAWIGKRRIPRARRTAAVIGRSELMPAIRGALKSAGWRLSSARSHPSLIIAGRLSAPDRRNLSRLIDASAPAGICLIDLENSCAKHGPHVTRLGKKGFLDNFYLTTAILLTSAI